MQEIYAEYEKYLKSKQILLYVDKITKNNAKKRYELHNILERWTLSSYNGGPGSDDQLARELIAKRINVKPNEFLDYIKNVKVDTIEHKIVSTPFSIAYGEFIYEKSRLKLLRTFATDEKIIQMLLKYAALFAAGQQWAVPLKVYIAHESDNLVEGFASPLNSQVMRIGRGHFCSLFSKTDQPFGSLGSFFENTFDGKTVIVNPPFIETLLLSAARHVINECCKNKRCTFIFYGPNWQDAEFYHLLGSSGWTVKREILRAGRYTYENVDDGRTINAKFDSVVFTLQK